MSIICTSDYTITDFNDAISLSGYISTNHPHSQGYSPDNDTYNPDWSVNYLVLTPQLYVTSTSSDVIATAAVTQVRWYLNSEDNQNIISTGGIYELSGAKSHILTVKNNLVQSNVKYICVIQYHDAKTGLDLTHKMDVSFSRVSSGAGIADAICYAPNGNVFKNDGVVSLDAVAELWRGSTVDMTNVGWQWYVMDSAGHDDESIVGSGWSRITGSTTGYSINSSNGTLTISASAVQSMAVYKCAIQDLDSSSDTSGRYFFDTITFVDLSDPIQCTIVSSGGDTFVNGNGSTVLTARLFRAGQEIDPWVDPTEYPSHVYEYTYKWAKYDKNSAIDENFGGTGVRYQYGKTLPVGSVDVDVKATFRCEVE